MSTVRFSHSILLLSCAAAGCGGSSSEVRIVGDDVQVSTDQLDITFARKEPVAETFMIFGGLDSDRSDSASKITIVGLAMEHARPIHAQHADFTSCHSEGASLAQRATVQMDIVPKDGVVLAELQRALADHESSLQSGGDRVCVAITGSVLGWKSATVDGQEVLDQLPAPVKRDVVLVETARVVPASTALGSP